MGEERAKIALVLLAFFLFSLIVIGLLWLSSGEHPLTLALAYAAGLSMIFLPCTLPLAFVIVPLSSGKGYKKGFLMALLFGLGLSITLTAYGVVVALLGDYLGLDNFTRAMFFAAGIFAYLFGLSQLNLFKLHLPDLPLPSFINEQRDYAKAFLMGLLLGNAGVGCPNPAFYVMLLYIATTGSVVEGGALGFIHGVGRATPLIFLSILAILGVNATSWLVEKRKAVERFTGWALLVVGVFIFAIGLFGMYWWEKSVFHTAWNEVAASLSPYLGETEKAAQTFNIEANPSTVEKYFPLAPWLVMLVLLLMPLLWERCKK